MAGIAGIAQSGKHLEVARMLDKIRHRGRIGSAVEQAEAATLGVVWSSPQPLLGTLLRSEHIVRDGIAPGQVTQVRATADGIVLKRDALGLRPLYYGWNSQKTLVFASEVKALLEATRDIQLLPPGHVLEKGQLTRDFELAKEPPCDDPPDKLASELRSRLTDAVQRRIGNGDVGAWLSGGLDSSVIAALARPCVSRLHTFAVGLPGASDLENARTAAIFIHSEHHELVVTLAELIASLPEVIYHLESFDALLVRSSLTNYLVAKSTADYVPAVFSGEAGDELFAGYQYLKSIPLEILPDELVDITGRLHNTAFQRVDRSAAAHGLVAHVPFADPLVLDLALRIPAEFKLHDNIEKWILRLAMQDSLPDPVLWRPKAKFWEGAGVGAQMADYANERIGDAEFERERELPNGWCLNSKEELMYYRIFREHFGEFENLDWMGRTKGARFK